MSHGQTELTVGAVAVGVILVVFLSSLINGLQAGLVEDVVGSIPHVTVEASSQEARPLYEVQGGSTDAITRLEKVTNRSNRIEGWQRVQASLLQMPSVHAVAPAVEGDGMITRGAKTVGARVVGIVPEDQCRVVSLQNKVIEGDLMRVDEQNVAIGSEMADDLGIGTDSTVRVTSNLGVTQTYYVACILDFGVEAANQSTVYMGLHSAQAMFRIGKDVTTLNVRGKRILDAEAIAEQVKGMTDLTVTSWMESNAAFLDSLRMQNTSAGVVQAMTLLASAFGVASVMIVFVVQKSKDIGILKSMGATSGQIRRVFILEGLGVGLGGALLGSGVGTGLCYLAKSIIVPGQTFGGQQATIVPMQFDIAYVIFASAVAMVMGLLSSVVPAHRAARLHPVEAIRRG